MPVISRRAFSALYVLSKRAFSQHVVETSWTSRSILHSKPTGPGENIRGSLEFVEWYNGGGLFHRTAHVDTSAFIEVGAIVHQKAIIGADVHIGSGSIVGPSVSIGQSTNIRYNAVLSNCSVGMSCVIHNGSCIGQDAPNCFRSPNLQREQGLSNEKNPALQNLFLMRLFACRQGDLLPIIKVICFTPLFEMQLTFCIQTFHILSSTGFGFFVDKEGNMMKKPQMLYVKIGDHVEIGANSCIDRGSWRDTVVGDYTKIDNLVQIGHNVVIGKYCMLCGQVGIAGSVTIGDYCTLGGRVALKDHVTISSKVRLAANSCVTKDLAEPGDYAGFPAVPIHQWRRQSAAIRRLSKKDLKGSGS